jgi:hypothetical protein
MVSSGRYVILATACPETIGCSTIACGYYAWRKKWVRVSRPVFDVKGDPIVSHQTMPHRTLTGGCLCGSVEYAVPDEFLYALNCHCSQCRRTTGSAFKPFAGIERGKLSVTKGVESLLIFGNEDGHDAHCKACGSLLYSVVRDGEFVHVTMGTLVEDPTIRPTAHIFVGSKAPWYTITDNLPQHEELP